MPVAEGDRLPRSAGDGLLRPRGAIGGHGHIYAVTQRDPLATAVADGVTTPHW